MFFKFGVYFIFLLLLLQILITYNVLKNFNVFNVFKTQYDPERNNHYHITSMPCFVACCVDYYTSAHEKTIRVHSIRNFKPLFQLEYNDFMHYMAPDVDVTRKISPTETVFDAMHDSLSDPEKLPNEDYLNLNGSNPNDVINESYLAQNPNIILDPYFGYYNIKYEYENERPEIKDMLDNGWVVYRGALHDYYRELTEYVFRGIKNSDHNITDPGWTGLGLYVTVDYDTATDYANDDGTVFVFKISTLKDKYCVKFPSPLDN